MDGAHGRKVGVWLDRRRALVADVTGARSFGRAPEVRWVESGVEDAVKHLGHQRNQPPQGGPRTGSGAAEAKHLEHRRDQEMRVYLGEVADLAAGADHVAVIGPGEAARELVAFLREDPRFRGAKVLREGADGHLSEAEAVVRLRGLLGESSARRKVTEPES